MVPVTTADSLRLLTLDVADIRVASNAPAQKLVAWEMEGFALEFRLPDSQDLMLIEAVSSVLFERCLLSAYRDGQPCSLGNLPDDVLGKVEAAMSEADPQADVQLDLFCPACQLSISPHFFGAKLTLGRNAS